MLFNESIGRTFDLFSVTKSAQQATHQCGLASAEIAFKVNDKTGHQYVPQPSPQCLGGGVIGKFDSYRFMIGHGRQN